MTAVDFQPTDAELLAQFVRDRDQVAFATLVERHGALVMGICRQVLRHRQDAEDAFQASFIILALRARSIRRASSLAGWLCRVSYRTAMRAAKRRQPLQSTDGNERARELDPLEEIYQDALQESLYSELNQLPESYRLPLVLCYLQQKSRSQAAAELESTEPSVKARLARGKRMLRLRLARRGVSLSVALGATLAGQAEAANLVGQTLVEETVSVAAARAIRGEWTLDRTSDVISLANQGNQAMLVSTLIKPLAATVAVSLACLSWSLKANGNDGPAADDTLQLVTDSTQPVENPGTPPTNLQNTVTPQAEWNLVQQLIKSRRGNNRFEAETLDVEAEYLENKSRAYLQLARAMKRKSRTAAEQFDRDEATGQLLLYEAEATRAKRMAALVRQQAAGIARNPHLPTRNDQSEPNYQTPTSFNWLPVSPPRPDQRRPLKPTRIEPGDRIEIRTLPDAGLDGTYRVENSGKVPLGPAYGRLTLAGVTLESAEAKLKKHLSKILNEVPRVQIIFVNNPNLPSGSPYQPSIRPHQQNQSNDTTPQGATDAILAPAGVSNSPTINAADQVPRLRENRPPLSDDAEVQLLTPPIADTQAAKDQAQTTIEILTDDAIEADVSLDVLLAEPAEEVLNDEVAVEALGVFEVLVDDAPNQALVNVFVGPAPAQSPPAPCCEDGNLALGNNASASTTEAGRSPAQAVDGDLSTRWCATGNKKKEYLQIELEDASDLAAVRIHWEVVKTVYRYEVLASVDGEDWHSIVDAKQNDKEGPVYEHQVDTQGTKFVRVVFHGNSRNAWASIRELELSEAKLAAVNEKAWEIVNEEASSLYGRPVEQNPSTGFEP